MASQLSNAMSTQCFGKNLQKATFSHSWYHNDFQHHQKMFQKYSKIWILKQMKANYQQTEEFLMFPYKCVFSHVLLKSSQREIVSQFDNTAIARMTSSWFSVKKFNHKSLNPSNCFKFMNWLKLTSRSQNWQWHPSNFFHHSSVSPSTNDRNSSTPFAL